MCSMTNASPSPSTRRLPVYVWLLTALGAVLGALLAEPGDVMGNTIPSAATFALAGLVIGLVVWVVQRRVGSRR